LTNLLFQNLNTEMSVIIVLVIIGVVVAGGFLVAFVWSVRSGQYDDTYSPAVRMLFDDTHPVDTPVEIRDKKNSEKTTTKNKEIETKIN